MYNFYRALCWFYGVKETDIHRTVCTFMVAVTLNNVVTEVIKNYVGYLRPVFFEKCIPDNQYLKCTSIKSDKSARTSFPSGHASLSVCVFTLLSMYLERQFGLSSIQRIKRTTYKHSNNSMGTGDLPMQPIDEEWRLTYIKDPFRYRVNSILALLPVAMGLMVASSRLVDNLHFPADVVGGSLLGGAIAIYTFRIWYVHLSL